MKLGSTVIKKNAWFRRMLASYVCVICVVFLAFLCLFYQRYSRQEVDKIRQLGDEIVLSNGYVIDEITTKINVIIEDMQGDGMFSVRNLDELAGGKQNNMLGAYRKKMSQYANEQYFADVMLYGRETGMAVDKYGVFLENGFFDYFYREENVQEFYDMLKGESSHRVFKSVQTEFGTGVTEKCIKVTALLDKYSDYIITFFLRTDVLYKMTDRSISDYRLATLLYGNSGELLDAFAAQESAVDIDGVAIEELAGRYSNKYFVFSGYDSGKIISEVLLLERSELRRAMNGIVLQMIFIFLLVMGVCIAALYAISKISMKPFLMLMGMFDEEEAETNPTQLVKRVHNMMDEHRSLQNNAARMKHVMVNSILFGLIHGDFSGDNCEFLDILESNNVDLYSVIVIDYLDIKSTVDTDAVFDECGGAGIKVYSVDEHNSDRITAIVTVSGGDSEAIFKFAESVYRDIYDRYGVYVTVGVGTGYADAMYLSQSYIEAEMAVEQSFTSGGGRIIRSDDMMNNAADDAEYPQEMLSEINHKIQLGDYDDAKEQVGELFEKFLNDYYPVNIAKCASYHIIITIMNIVSNNKISILNTKYQKFNVTEIVNVKYISQLKEIIDELIDILIAAKADSSITEGDDFAVKCIDYINREYTNPDFSVKKMSKDLNYSSGYMMRMFKTISDMTIMECVTELRMKKAKELLTETDMNISEIANRVGYLQTVTMNRNFKSYTGVTPSEYRKK